MVKINWIEFENLETGLKCERVNFNDDITLLVGLSGVGKTQIVNAIVNSLKLALNRLDFKSEFSATLNFTVGNHKEYEWSYVVKKAQPNNNELVYPNEIYEFEYEKLLIDKKQFFLRDKDKIELLGFKDFPTPKKNESLLSQYKDDDVYKEIVSDFNKTYPLNIEIDIKSAMEKETFQRFVKDVERLMLSDDKRDFSTFNNVHTLCKLYIAKKYYYDSKYNSIFNYVTELFPEIMDINVEEDISEGVYATSIDVYEKKILQPYISSGMLKTIYYIVELVVAKPGSVILIDEFENSLGMNCIGALQELLLSERQDLQFIITSHHPKVIRQISSCKWLIIGREKSVIKNFLCEDLEISSNEDDAYFELLNKWEFEGQI